MGLAEAINESSCLIGTAVCLGIVGIAHFISNQVRTEVKVQEDRFNMCAKVAVSEKAIAQLGRLLEMIFSWCMAAVNIWFLHKIFTSKYITKNNLRYNGRKLRVYTTMTLWCFEDDYIGDLFDGYFYIMMIQTIGLIFHAMKGEQMSKRLQWIVLTAPSYCYMLATAHSRLPVILMVAHLIPDAMGYVVNGGVKHEIAQLIYISTQLLGSVVDICMFTHVGLSNSHYEWEDSHCSGEFIHFLWLGLVQERDIAFIFDANFSFFVHFSCFFVQIFF